MVITGIHIEPTNLCTLKCAGCARTRFIQQWPRHWQNHNLDPDDIMRFLDINLMGIRITLCGNYGDAIYHPKILELIAKLKNAGAYITMHTNGSYRSPEWWDQLCALLDEHDQIVFAVDGMPENFTLYRTNADWPSIRQGIDICVAHRINCVWKYIVFAYNQQDIERARQLSQDLGMTDFVVDHSDRFDDTTQHLMPDAQFLGGKYQTQQKIKTQDSTGKVAPKCAVGDHHFISAEGFYTPCCYIGDHRFYYKLPWGKQKKQYSIKDNTLTSILGRPTVIDFYQNIPQNPELVCRYSCPATD